MVKYGLLLLLGVWGSLGTLHAQEATPPSDTPYVVQAWRAFYTDTPEDNPIIPDVDEEGVLEAAFLEFEGGMIAVLPGGDLLYTGSAQDGYTGQFLIPDPDIEITTTLQIVDEDTRTEVQSVTLFGTEQLSYVTYVRTGDTVEIWSESAREFTETTLLNTCLGLSPAPLSFGYVAPDLLMPFRLTEDDTVVMFGRTYVGGENEETSATRLGSGGVATIVTLRTLTITPDRIDFRLVGGINDRDDCELVYDSTFTPFDGDTASILLRAAEIGTVFARE